MASEATIVWSLRLVTIVVVLVPLALNYFSSGSLRDFLVPGLTIPLSPIINAQHSLHVTSMNYSVVGDTCLLSLRLSNTGSTVIGLKKFDCKVYVPSLNVSGRLVLQSPFLLKPAGEETVIFFLTLENSGLESLLRLLAQKPPVSLSGRLFYSWIRRSFLLT